MKTIIAGSRGIHSFSLVRQIIASCGWTPTLIISGGARGVDKLAEKYADLYNIPVKVFPADWNKYGNSAGYIRNKEMAEHAEALIAIWDGESKGTKHMINIAKKKGLICYIWVQDDGQWIKFE
jgi:hypothetical protein